MKNYRQRNFLPNIILLSFMLIINAIGFAQPSLSYVFEPHLKAEKPYIQVSFKAKTNALGVLLLEYDNNFWGQQKLFNCLQNIATKPQAQKIDIQPDSNFVKITHQPNTTLHITYQIVQDMPGKVEHKHCFRPIIQPAYFHSFGHRLFLIPEKALDYKIAYPVNIRWQNTPDNFVVHNSYGDATNQTLQVTKEDLYSSIFVAGDFKRYTFRIKGKKVHFLARGTWEHFTADDVYKLLKQTIRNQRDFWKDYSDSTYTVTLMDIYTPGGSSVGGTNLTKSFATYCSGNKYTTFDRIKYLYNHELMHNWVGKKIINADAERQYWFSEGFTDYYTYKMMLKNGQITLAKFVDMLNKRVFRTHYTSKVKAMPNDSLTYKRYWGNYAYQQLPYNRGSLYAFLLDTQIKQKTKQRKSLDNLMFDLLEACTGKKQQRLDHALFKKYLRRYLGKASARDFDNYIEKGQLIDFQKKLWKELAVTTVNDYPQLTLADKTQDQRLKQKLIK